MTFNLTDCQRIVVAILAVYWCNCVTIRVLLYSNVLCSILHNACILLGIRSVRFFYFFIDYFRFSFMMNIYIKWHITHFNEIKYMDKCSEWKIDTTWLKNTKFSTSFWLMLISIQLILFSSNLKILSSMSRKKNRFLQFVWCPHVDIWCKNSILIPNKWTNDLIRSKFRTKFTHLNITKTKDYLERI